MMRKDQLVQHYSQPANRIYVGDKEITLPDLQHRLRPGHLARHAITSNHGAEIPLEVLAELWDTPPGSISLLQELSDIEDAEFIELCQTMREIGKGDDPDSELKYFMNFINSMSSEEVEKACAAANQT